MISFPYTFQKPFPQYHHRGGGCSCGGYFGEIRGPDLYHSFPTVRSYDGAPTSSLDHFVNFKHETIEKRFNLPRPLVLRRFLFRGNVVHRLDCLCQDLLWARYADARLRATSRLLGCSLFKSFMLVRAGDIDMWQSAYLASANWFYTL